MEQDQLNEIVEQNPGIDQTAVERSRQVEERLAAVGIKIGGYRLAPALGGTTPVPDSVFNQRAW